MTNELYRPAELSRGLTAAHRPCETTLSSEPNTETLAQVMERLATAPEGQSGEPNGGLTVESNPDPERLPVAHQYSS